MLFNYRPRKPIILKIFDNRKKNILITEETIISITEKMKIEK